MQVTTVKAIRFVGIAFIALAFNLLCLVPAGLAGQAPGYARLNGHIPAEAMEKAVMIGRLPSATPISLRISLPLRNQQQLDEFINQVSDPADPLYGHYLTTQEFIDRFCPTQDDYDAVAAYMRKIGLTVTGTQPNRILLNVSGTAGTVEAAFKVHLNNYKNMDGRVFYAPDNNPQITGSMVSLISGIIGLDNAAVWRSHAFQIPQDQMQQTAPLQIGTGPGGGLTPNDVLTTYNLAGIAADGTGQVLGLFELAGYSANDIAAYTSYYGIRAVPLQNVLVDGYSGHAGSGADEVTLDIELQNALAPGASKIMVYEGPNTNTGVVDTYNRIATDNTAKQISTSWGLSEGQSSLATLNSEYAIFQQMAAQGQSIYAASGDSGAYDDGRTLSVDDPASQPFMVGVGGTQLFVNSGETYNYETTWNVNNTVSAGAGGGGISAIWSIPSWQQGIWSASSYTMRNVPDVSLNSDQYTGYSIYYKHGWYIYGGTSCAAPLWAAFTARVNQQRLANGASVLGFANPALYEIAKGSSYSTTFHDIDDGSTNLYYVAVPGYDDATGWGSFNGANLLAELSPVTSKPSAPTGLTATAGDSSVMLTWNASAGAASYNVYRSTTSGGEGTTAMVSDITSTSFTDNTVTNGTTYYYKVSATNTIGTSDQSNEASATPSATVLSITSGPTATTNKTGATINWTTNVASDSVVLYGTSSSALTSLASDPTLVTSHSVKLHRLSRRTTYYYQVSSTVGGTTVSSSVGTFTTQ
jgi:subtilase family serine protease